MTADKIGHPAFDHFKIAAYNPSCLTWQGDCLIDWRSGVTYDLDGSSASKLSRFPYRFDAAVRSPSGRYVVLYERGGTKGVILRDGQFVREIDRSFYCADAYDFPILLFDLHDGRPAIAHCPTDYNRLEIDLLETGERLTRRLADAPVSDFFHSGLAVDPGGQWLMSAGWVWHPAYEVCFYPIAQALEDPSILDSGGTWVAHNAELPSATFIAPDLAVLASDPQSENYDEDVRDAAAARRGIIGVYRPSSKTWLSQAEIDEPLGRIFAVDGEHVLSTFRHPKLVHVPSGRSLVVWPEIDCGERTGCICVADDKGPVANWDPASKRLAISARDGIHVLRLVT